MINHLIFIFLTLCIGYSTAHSQAQHSTNYYFDLRYSKTLPNFEEYHYYSPKQRNTFYIVAPVFDGLFFIEDLWFNARDMVSFLSENKSKEFNHIVIYHPEMHHNEAFNNALQFLRQELDQSVLCHGCYMILSSGFTEPFYQENVNLNL